MLNLFGYKVHPHGMTLHFPAALYPTAAVLFTLGLLFPGHFFEASSYYVLIVAAPVTPLAYATGYYYWRTKYKGFDTPLFFKKRTIGAVLWGLGLILILVRGFNPVIAYAPGTKRMLYIGCIYLAALLPIPLGYLGGKLVFRDE